MFDTIKAKLLVGSGLTEPYEDHDIKVLMATLSYPILDNGRFLGVAGIDFGLAQLQAVTAAIRPYGSGFMTIYSSKGMVLGAGDKTLVGKADPGLPAAARRAIRSGASLQYIDDAQVLHYIEPMRVGNIRNAWAVRISIPLERALADSRTATRDTILFSLGALLLILLVLGALLRRLTTPLTPPASPKAACARPARRRNRSPTACTPPPAGSRASPTPSASSAAC